MQEPTWRGDKEGSTDHVNRKSSSLTGHKTMSLSRLGLTSAVLNTPVQPVFRTQPLVRQCNALARLIILYPD